MPFTTDVIMSTFSSHLRQTPFRRVDRWVDHRSGFLLWPALWWQSNLEKGLHVRYSTLTLGIGRHRWRWTRGIQCNPIAGRIPAWGEIGGEAFLTWAKETFGGEWVREKAQLFFRKNPRWRDLVVLGGMENYYIRILLSREMLRGETVQTNEAGLDSLEEATS